MDEKRLPLPDTPLHALETAQLIALIFQDKSTSFDKALRLAESLLLRVDSPAEIFDIDFQDMVNEGGLSPLQANRLRAALVLGQRFAQPTPADRPLIRRPSDAIPLLRKHMIARNQEQLMVVLLDSGNRVLDIETVYVGSLNMTVVRVAEIFHPAIVYNSAGFILAHNHPSGDASPSPEDINLTALIIEAGKLLDIAVIDHLIIGEHDWVSLRERKLGF